MQVILRSPNNQTSNIQCSFFPTVCPPGFVIGRNDRCYTFNETPATWEVARASCQDSNPLADLVIFDDQAENDFIAEVANGTIWWIGKYKCWEFDNVSFYNLCEVKPHSVHSYSVWKLWNMTEWFTKIDNAKNFPLTQIHVDSIESSERDKNNTTSVI